MPCDDCRHEVAVGERTCPRCGWVSHAADPGSEPHVVEGTISPGEEGQIAYMPARAASSRQRALVSAAPTQPALVALARLPALAWRHPRVRSMMTTGAGAVALTVALRLGGRLVMRRGGRPMRNDLLPLLADMLQQGNSGQTIRRHARLGEVSETVFYMRRTVRW